MTNNSTPSSDTRGEGSTQREPTGRHTGGDSTTSNRRRFLLGVGGATALLAGCVGGGDDDSSGNGGDDGGDDNGDDGDDSGTGPGDDNGTDDQSDDADDTDGTDDSGNGDDGGGDDGSSDDGSDGTGNGDDGGSDDGSDDDGSDGTGNGDDGGSDDGGSDDGEDDDGSDGTGNGDDDGTGNDSDAEEFFAALAWEQEYRMVGTDEETGSTFEIRINGENSLIKFEGSGFGSIETYRIEDETYFVQGDTCTVYQNEPEDLPEDPTSVDGPDDIEEQEPAVTKVGTDTIDGDPVTVYELSSLDQGVSTFYLLDSGNVRRIESENVTVNFFDWGNTDPITPPDMECKEP